MIIIFFNNLTDEQKELINKIFSDMNALFYYISYGILKNQIDAEDAVAQTFLNISGNIEKISNFSCPEMRSYCVVILKNESINILRKSSKYISDEDIDNLYQNSNKDKTYNLEEEFLKTADKEILKSCISRLSEDEKNLIYLRFLNEFSFKQISELFDITEEAAKKRSQRILKKLRAYYEEGDKVVQND
ncbi:sigma-70 family RNA polymerase sigma factor [Sedimentibacter hydroxybenzoicus DSM 7310]|uniref:Sigma-70 family RNA polymerase sigma factor n=1 Tax=Sedimentibacter hydroxybenzoicus DSM 7310 TaxID=1123245 RepID=A0A974BLT3_SEDHY|nr:sigma-70 family RNA polymerase sigma factor [Sedimentibacter hydroxybenzoicus]NYB75528.1 sigma-70 family RNA polymerase sigma factor [Sedimentibacter hydroxybenzoicus DSM 7310]